MGRLTTRPARRGPLLAERMMGQKIGDMIRIDVCNYSDVYGDPNGSGYDAKLLCGELTLTFEHEMDEADLAEIVDMKAYKIKAMKRIIERLEFE
jgi:hypothetical protein